MMSVCYICCRYLFKGCFKEVRIILGTLPKCMLYLIFKCCSSIWFSVLSDDYYSILYIFSTFECEEDRANVSTLIISNLCPICFFLICSQFMSFNKPFFIVINRNLCNYTILCNISHLLTIYIHSCLVILLEISQFLEFI